MLPPISRSSYPILHVRESYSWHFEDHDNNVSALASSLYLLRNDNISSPLPTIFPLAARLPLLSNLTTISPSKWQTTSPPSSAQNKIKSTAPSTTKLAPAATAIAVPANTSSPPTHKPYYYPISTKTPPMTRKTR